MKNFILAVIVFVSIFSAIGCTKVMPAEPAYPTATATIEAAPGPTMVPTVDFYFTIEPLSGNVLTATVTFGAGGITQTAHLDLDYSSSGTVPLWVHMVNANQGDLYTINILGSSVPLRLKVYKKGENGVPIFFHTAEGLTPGMEIILQ